APAVGAVVNLLDDPLAVLRTALARHHGEQQAVLRIDRRVIPVVSRVVVAGVAGVRVLLLLGDEVPLLVELHLTGQRGKKPRARRAGPWPGRRPWRGGARWRPWRPRSGGWWRGCRTPRGGGSGHRRPCRWAVGSAPGRCPFARSRTSYRCGSRPCGST